MTNRRRNTNINLIECADHKLAPWSIVCVQLVEGRSRNWISLPSNNPEVEFDWVCPECEQMLKKTDTPPDLNKLKAICIHCVRLLRKNFDPQFQ